MQELFAELSEWATPWITRVLPRVAIEIGYRVILVTDALCSSSDATHDALMTVYHQRFAQQVETVEMEVVLSAWA